MYNNYYRQLMQRVSLKTETQSYSKVQGELDDTHQISKVSLCRLPKKKITATTTKPKTTLPYPNTLSSRWT